VTRGRDESETRDIKVESDVVVDIEVVGRVEARAL